MSFNRRKNPYTLGDFVLQSTVKKQYSQADLKRYEQLPDVFERDPFKVQSYNFRYAEANFPLQTPYLSSNENFSAAYNNPYNLPQSNYHEARRRKFVQSASSVRPSSYAEVLSRACTAPSSPQLRPECSNNSAHTISDYNARTYAPYRAPAFSNFDAYSDRMCHNNRARNNNRVDTSTSRCSIGLQKKSSNQSLCKINIQIKCSQDNLLSDNVTISIATDKNNTVRASKSTYSTNRFVIKPETSQSAATILIKRPSRQSLRLDSHSRSRDHSLSSGSSSDYVDSPREKNERTPQFITITKAKTAKTAANKPKTSVQSEQIPFTAPPWAFSVKSAREKSALSMRTSNQSILNNLNSRESKTKCSKTHTNLRSEESRLQATKRCATNFEPNRTDRTKVAGSAVKQRRSGSTVHKTDSIRNMPIR